MGVGAERVTGELSRPFSGSGFNELDLPFWAASDEPPQSGDRSKRLEPASPWFALASAAQAALVDLVSSSSKLSRPKHKTFSLSIQCTTTSAMEARLIRRPLVHLLSGRLQRLLALNAASSRYESSYRRSKKRLNVKPDPSFLQSADSPRQDHIIFNPPPSAPSVLHTPIKFLPKEDKRKQLLEVTAQKLSSSQTRLPPPIRPKPKVPHHHLNDKDIAEIMRLKQQEPDAWDNAKLARKFNCSSYFISVCLSECGVDNTKRKKEMQERLEAVKARWGPRRRKAEEERERRFQLAYRGE
jgi:hypothetical protein